MKKNLLIFLAVLSCPVMAGRLNVQDFGAKGDGLTDDFPAIQRAFNLAEKMRAADERIYANNYGEIHGWGVNDGSNPEIYFPKGIYRLSRTLVGIKSVTVVGEDGAVLEGTDDRMLLLYFDRAFRCTVRNMTFRKGGSHICFWTANQDTASILFENCRFENASDYAVFTEAWSSIVSDNWDKLQMVSPYKLEWEDELPVLKRQHWEKIAPNSTRFCLRNCYFFNCGGAFRGATDGVYIKDCKYKSELPQRLPPWQVSSMLSIYNTETIANIPADFSAGWINAPRGLKHSDLRQLVMKSTSEYGTQLLVSNLLPRSKLLTYSEVYNCVIVNCTADAGNSPVNALVEFKQVETAHLMVAHCHEGRGRQIDLFKFNWIPQTEADLFEVCSAYRAVPLPKPGLTHSIILKDNGPEIRENLPEILKQFQKEDISEEIEAEFPVMEQVLRPQDRQRVTRVLRPEDFGLSETVDKHDTEKLEAMLAAAAREDLPLILLPSRRLEISRTLLLPKHAILEAEGRTFISGKSRDFDLFKVPDGNGFRLEFHGITFNGGRNILEAVGYGDILVRNCVAYDNHGFRVERATEAPLHLEIVDTTVYSPVLVNSIRADVRIFDCWGSIQATLEKGAFLRNDRGIMLLNNLLGVPVVFCNSQRYPNWPYGHDIFWIKNNNGTVRTRNVRYGGEFGGIPVMDNWGKGKFLIEGHSAHYGEPASAKVLFRNHSAEALAAIRQVASMHGVIPGCNFCEGVLPDRLYVTGFLNAEGIAVRPFVKTGK